MALLCAYLVSGPSYRYAIGKLARREFKLVYVYLLRLMRVGSNPENAELVLPDEVMSDHNSRGSA